MTHVGQETTNHDFDALIRTMYRMSDLNLLRLLGRTRDERDRIDAEITQLSIMGWALIPLDDLMSVISDSKSWSDVDRAIDAFRCGRILKATQIK